MKNPPKRKSVKATNLNNNTKGLKKDDKTASNLTATDQSQDSANNDSTAAIVENELKINDVNEKSDFGNRTVLICY